MARAADHLTRLPAFFQPWTDHCRSTVGRASARQESYEMDSKIDCQYSIGCYTDDYLERRWPMAHPEGRGTEAWWTETGAEEWSDAIVAAMKLGGVDNLFFVSG